MISLDCKEIKLVNPKRNQSWIFIGRTDAKAETNTLATWCEEVTPWKRLWRRESLKAAEEGDNRGWDSWMASLTRWTWVWVSSESWWWTGKLMCYSPWGCKEWIMTERLLKVESYTWFLGHLHEDLFRLDACSQSCCCLVTELCTTIVTPWAIAHQAPLSMWDFPGKNYGVPFPSTSLVLVEILYDYILSPLLVYQLHFVYFWLHHVLVAACGIFHCGTWASL